MRLPPVAASELRFKYVEMLAMRIDHARGAEDPARVRVRMGALAARFPGSLREIDVLTVGEIRMRIERLDGVLSGRCEVEPWMVALSHFHRLMRGALCAKRWLNGERRIDAESVPAFTAAANTLAFPDDARAWAADLAAIARPPGGRLTDLVLARIAHLLGTTEKEAHGLVFGAHQAGLGRPGPAR